MSQRFEWDQIKANLNLQKHQVSFEEARTVFDDPLFITFLDIEHSLDEERYITIGFSQRNRLLLVAHTERKETIRIISAREAMKNERRYYEESPT
ncbi:MAG: BrnT family toxin [Anaerolineales bacterium]|nr:BrnT family toxin [Anaerolineales bacterium]